MMITQDDMDFMRGLKDDNDDAVSEAARNEKTAVFNLAARLWNSGVMDELIAAGLTASLENSLEFLQAMHLTPVLKKHEWEDYANNLKYARSLIGVLQNYTTSTWGHTLAALEIYEQRLKDMK
jgi:hypothetical protein